MHEQISVYSGKATAIYFINVIDKPGMSLYFMSFPEDWTMRSMWIHFQTFGEVLDILIPAKQSRLGMKFGFAKYKDIKDIKQLVSSIRVVAVGAEYLVINEARFRRGEVKTVSQGVRKTTEEVPTGRRLWGWERLNKQEVEKFSDPDKKIERKTEIMSKETREV